MFWKFHCIVQIVFLLIIITMTTEQVQKSSCIFCNIANKLENTEILFEDEDVSVFRDIKPASRFHFLIIPKRHITDARSLTAADKDLVDKMLAVAKEMLSKNNMSLEDARLGYHWPPFRSVHHLHLHAIAPESEIGFFGRMMFWKNSYWFVTTRRFEPFAGFVFTGRLKNLMSARESLREQDNKSLNMLHQDLYEVEIRDRTVLKEY